MDHEGHEGDRAFYLEAWNGHGSFVYDRIGRGTIRIETACVCVLGGIQPGPLSSYVLEALRNGSGSDGLLQRLQMAVYPDDAGEWRDVDRWPDTEAKNRAFELYRKMDTLVAFGVGARKDDDSIPYLRFSPGAQEVFTEWRGILEKEKLRSGEPEVMESHLAKYRSLAPSLALLCHLADDGIGPVTEAAMLRAAAWCEYLETHARRIYSDALSPERAAAKALAGHILNGDVKDGFTPRSVYNQGWHCLNLETTQRAIAYLEDVNWLCSEKTQTGGRPSIVCRLNPKLEVKP